MNVRITIVIHAYVVSMPHVLQLCSVIVRHVRLIGQYDVWPLYDTTVSLALLLPIECHRGPCTNPPHPSRAHTPRHCQTPLPTSVSPTSHVRCDAHYITSVRVTSTHTPLINHTTPHNAQPAHTIHSLQHLSAPFVRTRFYHSSTCIQVISVAANCARSPSFHPVMASITTTGNSRFLAYLEQRRSLTASQSSGIAAHLRDYETRKADLEADLSRTQPSSTTRAASSVDSGDEEHKETIISSASTLSTASSSASDLSPLTTPPNLAASSAANYYSSSYIAAPASSLLHRELVDMRLRLQRSEDEHMSERKRWEQQRAAERREAEEWKRKAEEKREREEEWEDERNRLRTERDEWQSERLLMQQELDRLTVYFQQLSSSPTAAASSSSSLSSALSIVAVAKDREENNRLRRKNNRLIDAVNHKQTDCDTLSTQLAQLTQWRLQHEQQTSEHTMERTRWQQQVEQLTSEVARLKKQENEWQQRQTDKKDVERARLQYGEKEAKYKRREEEYKQSIERLTQLAADRKNVNNELEWMKDKVGKLEDREQQLTTQCTQWKERVEEAEKRADEERVECREWKNKCASVEKELAVAIQQREWSGVHGSSADSEWVNGAGERLQMDERLAKLEHERAVLEQLLRKEREAMAGVSTTGSVKAAAMHALEAFVPVASPISSKAAAFAIPSPPTAVSSESLGSARPLPSPAKRDPRTTPQHAASLPTSVNSTPSPSPSSAFFRHGRRASLPAPQQLTHSVTQPLPSSVVHRSALKAPLRAVHPIVVQEATDLPLSTVASSSSSSPRSTSPSSASLTSSGGSVHRVRFASPLSMTAEEAVSSVSGVGVLTTRDDNSLKDRRDQQPDTPTRSRLKQIVLGFF